MGQNRQSERARSYLGANVIFNNLSSTLQCRIRDISPTGAKLMLSNTVTLPDEFDLDIPQRGRTYRARLRWRDEQTAGVEFVNAPAHDKPDLDPVLKMTELEAENAALRRRVLELTEKLKRAEAGKSSAA